MKQIINNNSNKSIIGQKYHSDSGVYLGNTRIYEPTRKDAACSPSKKDLIISPDGVIVAELTDEENQQLNILKRFIRQTAASRLLRKKRVHKCLRVRISKTVKVYKSQKHGKCHFGDLFTCTSVWDCPVCSAKISELRRIELSKGVNQYKDMYGGSVLLVTFTYPHKKQDNLKELLIKQSKAFEWFYRHRTYKELKNRYRKDGKVRALEVNHGEVNGWHPHVHELWFVGMHLHDYETLKLEVFNLWCKACEKYGLGRPSWKHGIDIRGGDEASNYVAKYGLEESKKGNWSVEHELTKANAKKGRNGSLSPFELLDHYIEGDKQKGALFVEYSKAFHRKNQLSWSKGLKKMFNLDEVTDEELAQLQDDEALLLTEIMDVDWDLIVKKCNYHGDPRNLILTLGKNGGADAINCFISGLASSYKNIN